MRRSIGFGTSGARRSAASGTPNSTTQTMETAAAIDQPTIFATPRREVWWSSSRTQRAVTSEASRASRISSRASGGAEAQASRKMPGGLSARRMSA
jgi:hypothetical protein